MDDYDPAAISARTSFTFQTSPALPFSIKEYIGLASASHYADDDRIERALVDGGAAEIVAGLKEGWHSYPGGVMGSRLSDDWELPRIIPAHPKLPSVEPWVAVRDDV